ncbi:CBS domain-containing protein [Desulfovibrio inopinatus]|uniref:CBS domain-containing protein n=1 Tax=Desulfovibrio inopinatus TaxID=102109 RepID=UPI00041C6D73|nr:CBS domain-containing protein [Desulfovibrio inopinatus]
MLLLKRVFDLMRTDVSTVEATAPAWDAVKTILASMEHDNSMGACLIVNNHGEYEGILSVRDVLKHLDDTALNDALRMSLGADFEFQFEHYTDEALRVSAGSIARKPQPLTPTEPLAIAASAMMAECRRFCPVVDNGKALGIVNLDDMFRLLVNPAVIEST